MLRPTTFAEYLGSIRAVSLPKEPLQFFQLALRDTFQVPRFWVHKQGSVDTPDPPVRAGEAHYVAGRGVGDVQLLPASFRAMEVDLKLSPSDLSLLSGWRIVNRAIF